MKAFHMMGPSLRSDEWEYVGEFYPWHLFRRKVPQEKKRQYREVPGLFYTASASLIILDVDGREYDRVQYRPLFPNVCDYEGYLKK